MSESILSELNAFAAALIEAQETLLEIMRRKRIALTTSDTAALETLQAPELEAARKLQVLVAWRARLLQAAKRTGGGFPTIWDLTTSLTGSRSAPVLALLERARQLAGDLRQESWVQWVITNRCCNYYGEVLELISHNGKKSPTYHEADSARRGGALIDACA